MIQIQIPLVTKRIIVKAFDSERAGSDRLIGSMVFDIEKYVDKSEGLVKLDKNGNFEWVDIYGAYPKETNKESILM